MTQKLHFSNRELKNAFTQFAKKATSTSVPISVPIKKDFILYAIYAVECGLKYILLENLKKDTTKRLEDDHLTHDLNLLLKMTRINKQLPTFRRKVPPRNTINNINITSGKLHQLYRYGGKLDSECEEKLIGHLFDIFTKIEEFMRI